MEKLIMSWKNRGRFGNWYIYDSMLSLRICKKTRGVDDIFSLKTYLFLRSFVFLNLKMIDLTQVICEVMQYMHPEVNNVFFLNKELYDETKITRKHLKEKGRKKLRKFFDDENVYREWYPNGTLKLRYSYKRLGNSNGRINHGLVERWYPDGKIAAEGVYDDGNLVAIVTWFPCSRLDTSITFTNPTVSYKYIRMLWGD